MEINFSINKVEFWLCKHHEDFYLKIRNRPYIYLREIDYGSSPDPSANLELKSHLSLYQEAAKTAKKILNGNLIAFI